MKPCQSKNSNVCVAEGCYDEACEREGIDPMSSSDQERQARALEGIERNTHEMVKVLVDLSKGIVDLHETFKEAADAVEQFMTAKEKADGVK